MMAGGVSTSRKVTKSGQQYNMYCNTMISVVNQFSFLQGRTAQPFITLVQQNVWESQTFERVSEIGSTF